MGKDRETSFILWFDEIGIEDVPLVGGKNASLGEMRRDKHMRVEIPQGFAITSYSYRYFLEKAGVLKELKTLFKGLNIHDSKALENVGAKARKIIMDCELPKELQIALEKAYLELSKKCKVKDVDVAVRSSATAEDLPMTSFAGQQ